MESNAWDRAQEAIDRAERRDRSVVTPDNAVSPFDASATTIIARPTVRPGSPAPAPRPGPNGRHQRPDGSGSAGGADAARRVPDPRAGATPAWEEPPTTPVEVSDPNLLPVPVGAGAPWASPSGSGGSAGDADRDVTTETLRTSTGAGTAPFAATGPEPATTPPAGRRPWWRRLFGRGR